MMMIKPPKALDVMRTNIRIESESTSVGVT